MREQQTHPLWIGCSDMELVICETFFPVAWKIIVEKNKNIIIMLWLQSRGSTFYPLVSFRGKGVRGFLKARV